MPTFKLNYQGKRYNVDAPDVDIAIGKVKSFTGQSAPESQAPTPTAPAPEFDADKALDTTGKVLGGLGAVAGTAVPIMEAAATGAPMLPVLGGLAGGALVGAGAHALGEATGAYPAMRETAQKIRSTMDEPQSPSVGKNLLLNYLNEFRPQGMAATALEAAPMLADTYAAVKGGGALGKFLSPSKVPVGQEGRALVNTIGEQFGTPKAPEGSAPMTTGELRDSLDIAKRQLGGKVGEAKEAAYKAAGDVNPDEAVKAALKGTLEKLGIRNPETSASPEAAQALIETMGKSPQNLAEAGNLKSQLSDLANPANKMAKPSTNAARILGEGASAIDQAVKSFIPAEQLGNLEAANKPFSQISELVKMGYKDGDASGSFGPKRFASAWNRMKPSDKARIFEPSQVKALDDLVRQDPGAILGFVEKVKNTLPLSPTIKNLLPKPAVRFNQPKGMKPQVSEALKLGNASVNPLLQLIGKQ